MARPAGSPSAVESAWFTLSAVASYDTLDRQMASAMGRAEPYLLSAEGRARLKRWQESLGANPPVTVGGFEIHLNRAGEPAGRVDLAFAPAIRRGTALEQLPPFPGLERLTRPLAQLRQEGRSRPAPGERPLIADVPLRDLWVEYDVDGTDSGPSPLPGPPSRPAWLLGPTRSAGRDPMATVRLVRALLRAARREPESGKLEALTRILRQVLSRLSAGGEGAFVDYVGLMAGRPDAPVRINIAGLAPEAVLKELGGDASLLPVLQAAQRLAYTFDVYGDTIGPRRGVELFTAPVPFAVPSSAREILARLSALGLLSADTAAALLRWPGASPVRLPDLDALATFFYGYGRHYLLRNLNHLKLVVAPGAPVGVKAYLGFCHAWFPGP